MVGLSPPERLGMAENTSATSWNAETPLKKKYYKTMPITDDAPVEMVTPQELSPIAPITPAEWEAMDGKARWDSQVALRGPDLYGSQTVKWFTSSIIRHRLSGVMRVGGLVNDAWPFVVIPRDPSSIARHARGSFDWNHFIGHVAEASAWLRIPLAKVPPHVWKITVVSGMDYITALRSIHGFLSDPYKDYTGKALNSWGTTPLDPSWLKESSSANSILGGDL